MKVGLSLGVSQHLALTPQLQQSIRLLQLSTLELAQEVEAMLVDNPFLERIGDDPVAEAADARLSERAVQRDQVAPISEAFDADPARAQTGGQSEGASDWEGDSDVDPSGSDSPWSADAPIRAPRADDDEENACERESAHETLADHLHRQALALRLSRGERAALSYLIDSLNEDG